MPGAETTGEIAEAVGGQGITQSQLAQDPRYASMAQQEKQQFGLQKQREKEQAVTERAKMRVGVDNWRQTIAQEKLELATAKELGGQLKDGRKLLASLNEEQKKIWTTRYRRTLYTIGGGGL